MSPKGAAKSGRRAEPARRPRWGPVTATTGGRPGRTMARFAGREAAGERFDLFAGDFAGVVFEEAGDGPPAEVEAEEVHVAEIEDEAFAGGGDALIVEGAERGCGAGIHKGCRGLEGGSSNDGPGAREVGREGLGRSRKGEKVVAGADGAGEVVEAEDAVGGAGRRLAVVEAGDGDTVEVAGDFEGGECGTDGVEVKVAEDDAVGVEAGGFVVADDGDAELPDAVEVVVEGAGGIGGGEGGEAGTEVVFEGPGAGAAAGDGPGDEERAASGGCAADAGRSDGGGGGQDHLGGVFDGAAAVEEEDVLGAGANVDREDAHRDSVERRGNLWAGWRVVDCSDGDAC